MSKGKYIRTNKLDLSGQRFGKIIILERDENKSHYWMAKCDCGREYSIAGGDLTRKNRKINSCHKCMFRAHNKSHAKTKTIEYRTWNSMIQRCTKPSHSSYKYYGARGVTVYPEWIGAGGFEKFLNEVGQKPEGNYSLDRIDSSKGYEPNNLRWATIEQQNRNKKTNKHIRYAGMVKIEADWAKFFGVGSSTLNSLIRYHKNVNKVFDRLTFRDL